MVFHAGIEQDAGRFDVDDVCDAVCRRLIQRHPHLFQQNAERADWEEIKRHLRGDQTVVQEMEGVSKALPALWQADKILSKAEQSGLEPRDAEAARQELTQQAAALCRTEGPEASEHLGRALLALVRLARCRNLDPETALAETCRQFIGGFSQREAAAKDEK